jgi:hypothetical protein
MKEYIIKYSGCDNDIEKDFEEVAWIVENDLIKEEDLQAVEEVWRGKVKIFDRKKGWYKDKLLKSERKCLDEIKTYYGVDIGLYYKDSKISKDIDAIMNRYRDTIGYSMGIGLSFYDWQVEFDSEEQARQVYDELLKKNKIKFKTYWETGMTESYINLYKERRV